MPGLKEMLFGPQSKEPSKPVEKSVQGHLNYNLQEGHAYVLLGGAEKEILTACPGCGAPFKGPCQGSCEYCSTHRKVHYADITDISILSVSKDSVENLSFVLPGGDEAEFGYGASVDMVVAEKVTAGEQFRANLVVTKRFDAGYHPNVGTLILVDKGSALIDDQAEIGTLITGKDVGPVEIGFNANIDRLFKTSGLRYKTGDDCYIGEVKIITQDNFIEAISQALQRK